MQNEKKRHKVIERWANFEPSITEGTVRIGRNEFVPRFTFQIVFLRTPKTFPKKSLAARGAFCFLDQPSKNHLD
jgi:hypothetical protein